MCGSSPCDPSGACTRSTIRIGRAQISKESTRKIDLGKIKDSLAKRDFGLQNFKIGRYGSNYGVKIVISAVPIEHGQNLRQKSFRLTQYCFFGGVQSSEPRFCGQPASDCGQSMPIFCRMAVASEKSFFPSKRWIFSRGNSLHDRLQVFV